jgi:hypothetical protein
MKTRSETIELLQDMIDDPNCPYRKEASDRLGEWKMWNARLGNKDYKDPAHRLMLIERSAVGFLRSVGVI